MNRLQRIESERLEEPKALKPPEPQKQLSAKQIQLLRIEVMEEKIRSQIRETLAEGAELGFDRVEEIVAEELYSSHVPRPPSGSTRRRRIATAATAFGSLGGRARAQALTSRQRSAIARKGARARAAKLKAERRLP